MPNAVFENILTLDNKEALDVRSVYSFMDILGDIAGMYGLIQSFVGVLFFRISKISFYISAMKKIFFVKSKNRNIFEEKMANEGHDS